MKDNIEAVEFDVAEKAILGMEVEMPYVPASQRNITQVVDDSIVVVGQVRQKKRKRAKATTVGTDASAEASNEVGRKEVIPNDESATFEQPFDFSAVPNILDDNPNIEDSKKKRKQKKQKTGKWLYYDMTYSILCYE